MSYQIWICSKSSGKELYVLGTRSKGQGHRCVFSQLGERSTNVFIPSFYLDPEMFAKDDKRQSPGSACGSSMDVQTMVSNIVGPSGRSAMSTASRPSLGSSSLGRSTTPSSQSHHNFRLAMWPLSGNLCFHRIYQKGCLKFYWLHGK